MNEGGKSEKQESVDGVRVCLTMGQSVEIRQLAAALESDEETASRPWSAEGEI